MGSWVLYGLGTENQNLPGYITIKPDDSPMVARRTGPAPSCPAPIRARQSAVPGMKVADIQGQPIDYLLNKMYTPEEQRFELDMLQNINRRHAEAPQA
jgi:hypothetical protein